MPSCSGYKPDTLQIVDINRNCTGAMHGHEEHMNTRSSKYEALWLYKTLRAGVQCGDSSYQSE